MHTFAQRACFRFLTGSAALVGILGPDQLRAQADLSKVEIKIVPIAPQLYMLQGAGGNMALSAGTTESFIVDDQYAPLTAKIRAAVASVSSGNIRFVLNTHWHGDHTGGNENMSGAGAIVIAHDNVYRRMSVTQFIEALNATVPPSPFGALPVISFSESVQLHVNGDSIRALHVRNAHTDGDAVVIFQQSNVVHMGDVFFNGSYPFIDVSTGGSVRGLIAAVDSVMRITNAQTRFIPGHGPLGTRADIIVYRRVVKTISDRVASLIARGKSREQVIAARPSAEFDLTWGNGFMKPDQFVSILYASLKQKEKRNIK